MIRSCLVIFAKKLLLLTVLFLPSKALLISLLGCDFYQCCIYILFCLLCAFSKCELTSITSLVAMVFEESRFDYDFMGMCIWIYIMNLWTFHVMLRFCCLQRVFHFSLVLGDYALCMCTQQAQLDKLLYRYKMRPSEHLLRSCFICNSNIVRERSLFHRSSALGWTVNNCRLFEGKLF